MGCRCSVSNNVVAPSPEDVKIIQNQKGKGGNGRPIDRTASASEKSGHFKSVVQLNDIIVDKSVRHTFVDYIKKEKELIEEEVRE